MDHQTQLVAIKQVVTETLAEMGIDPTSAVHTFLIRDGYFAGDKIRCEGGCAIWLLGAPCIDFYDQDGQLVKTVELNIVEEAAASPESANVAA